jgi:GNAT superfamily N-acetyltransferase
MTKRAWTMRPLEPADIGSFRDLYHELHGFRRPAAYDEWFFNGNVCGFAIGMVATAGSRLAGVYMLMPVDILVSGRRMRGAQSVDTMTAPDFRNQGIFVALATATVERAAAEGCEVLYGLPNENSYPGFVRRLAWTHTGNIVRWLRILAPGRIGRVPAIVARPLDAIAVKAPTLAWGGYSVRFDPLSNEVVSDLLSQPLAEASACMIARDSRWMGWRYAKATGMDYEWVSAWRDGRCLRIPTQGGQ